MLSRPTALDIGIIDVRTVVGLLSLTSYRFDYGTVESAVLAVCLVLVTLRRTVLGDAFSPP